MNKINKLIAIIKPYLPVLSFMIPSILIGTLIGTYPGYKVYEYVWKDAGFCVTCHVHDYATVSWRNSSHKRLTTCHDCHHQPLHEYVREAIVLITKRPKFPKDLDHVPNVPKDLCFACHLSNYDDISTVTGPLSYDDIKKLPKVDKMYLHNVHLSKETDYKIYKEFKISKKGRIGNHPIALSNEKGETRKISCSDCHGGPTNRAHNFTAVDLSCTRCHNSVHQKSKMTKKYGCRVCHFPEFSLPLEDAKKYKVRMKKKILIPNQ